MAVTEGCVCVCVSSGKSGGNEGEMVSGGVR